MKFLIVDDHITIRQQLSRFIQENTDAKADSAENGKVALEMLSKESYDLLIVDINMPDMDGVEMTEQFRKIDRETPVVCLSMMDDPVSVQSMMDAGATEYVVKDGDPFLILATIKRLLARKSA